MKTITITLILFVLSSVVYSGNKINYLQPVPEAKYVNINNNIIIGFDNEIRLSPDDINASIKVKGTKSKLHSGTVMIYGDNKKIIFKPSVPFSYDEEVEIKIEGKLRNFMQNRNYVYTFKTASEKMNMHREGSNNEIISYTHNLLPLNPQFNVSVNNNPADGYLFLSPYFNSAFLEIRDKNGNLYWSQQKNFFCCDWKKQPNNNYTYYNNNVHEFFELDVNYNLIRQYSSGNGYTTDNHELRILNNGHALLMACDSQIVNMGLIVPGGVTNALVIGLIIQEIDSNEVVFQWRSWDHFQITDAWHQNMLTTVIDAVHGNAIELDNDGNIMISSRHLDEITKINRTTGDIIWRLGGKNNQFTFLNDTLKFTYQHAIRRISNGNITLYDNGNFHEPAYSRAVEYALDEVNKTASAVWQYRNNPDIFGSWGGFVQRLENGNTLISWGGAYPTISEVDSMGVVRFEASYQSGYSTYRAFKFQLPQIPVGNNNSQFEIPELYSLQQNFPNPFNPVTNISYDVSKASFVELTVYDIMGREAGKLVSEYKQPGKYTAVFDGSELSSGIYFYKLRAGDFAANKKMILMK